MRVSRKLIVGVLAALAVGAATGSVLIENASARGYTCSYAATNGIYFTIHGADNKAKYCRFIAQSGHRRVSRVSGRRYCVFAMRQMDVRMTVRATNGYAGPIICNGLEAQLPSGWRRVR